MDMLMPYHKVMFEQVIRLETAAYYTWLWSAWPLQGEAELSESKTHPTPTPSSKKVTALHSLKMVSASAFI